MPISPIQLISGNTPQGFTTLLRDSGNVLSNALNNAVQLGRDAVDLQLQQENVFLKERRDEINLAQRRGENLQDQSNKDRRFGLDQDRFTQNVFEDKRDFARGVFENDRGFAETQERNDLLNESTQLSIDLKREDLTPEAKAARENKRELDQRRGELDLEITKDRLSDLPRQRELEDAKFQLEKDKVALQKQGKQEAAKKKQAEIDLRQSVADAKFLFEDTKARIESQGIDPNSPEGRATLAQANQDFSTTANEAIDTAAKGGVSASSIDDVRKGFALNPDKAGIQRKATVVKAQGEFDEIAQRLDLGEKGTKDLAGKLTTAFREGNVNKFAFARNYVKNIKDDDDLRILNAGGRKALVTQIAKAADIFKKAKDNGDLLDFEDNVVSQSKKKTLGVKGFTDLIK